MNIPFMRPLPHLSKLDFCSMARTRKKKKKQPLGQRRQWCLRPLSYVSSVKKQTFQISCLTFDKRNVQHQGGFLRATLWMLHLWFMSLGSFSSDHGPCRPLWGRNHTYWTCHEDLGFWPSQNHRLPAKNATFQKQKDTLAPFQQPVCLIQVLCQQNLPANPFR